MSSLPPPKAPSSVVKVSRWSLLLLGVLYGHTRHNWLKKKEDCRRKKEERERPAKEAKMKAEREKRNEEEMAMLRQQAGGADGGKGGKGNKGGKEECEVFKF